MVEKYFKLLTNCTVGSIVNSLLDPFVEPLAEPFFDPLFEPVSCPFCSAPIIASGSGSRGGGFKYITNGRNSWELCSNLSA